MTIWAGPPSHPIRALQRDGWYIERQAGHIILVHPTRPGTAVVPRHKGKVLPPGTLKSILDAADLSADRFSELL